MSHPQTATGSAALPPAPQAHPADPIMGGGGGQVPPLLAPLRFPLRGSRLIEASAGTGKTFTIAALYLRLVLGHGGEEAGFGRPLVPPEILVVTFTDAATQELRDRIRARLAEAAEAFAQDPASLPPHVPGQNLLDDLRADHPPAQWPLCAHRLRSAAEWMDEAAVSTIHGWANRMLREHAFDSGSLFTLSLEADLRALVDEAVRDYWRRHVLPLGADDTAALAAWWSEPAALAQALRPLVSEATALQPASDLPAAPPDQALAQARQAAARQLAALKAPWAGSAGAAGAGAGAGAGAAADVAGRAAETLGWADQLLALLEAGCASGQLAKTKLGRRRDWCAALRDWALGDALLPALSDTAYKRLTPEGLSEATLQGPPPQHPALFELPLLRQRLKALPSAEEPILRHAAAWVAEHLARAQAERAQMGFDGLLTQLDAALHGPHGDALAATIRRQFPVALIDEFQDTDPVQYRLFDRVYRLAENAPDTALVLIGDPKQAIYAFRGADIHTYLAARAATGHRHATLGTNFRSTPAMVAAVNALFSAAEARAGGAFGFAEPGGANPVPFQPVAARGRAEQFWRAGQPAAALNLWTLHSRTEGKALGVTEARHQLARACAAEVAALLREGDAGHTGLRAADGVLQPLRPRDMAVLVNSQTEANAVRQALAALGIKSVYLSDRDSVFASPLAGDVQRWLQAVAEPGDERQLRAALASPVLGLDWATLDALNHDELAWEQRVQQFRAYQQVWRRQGVLPMLRRLLHDFGVPARLLAGASGAGDAHQPQAADARGTHPGATAGSGRANPGGLRLADPGTGLADAGSPGLPDAGQGERQLTDLLHLAELAQQAQAEVPGEAGLLRWLAQQRQAARDNAGSVASEALKLRLESDADRVQVVTVHKSKGLEYPLVFLPFAWHTRRVAPDSRPVRWHDAEGQRRIAALAPDAEALRLADQERLGEDLRKLYVALTRARHATWVGAALVADVRLSALGHLLLGPPAVPPAPGAKADPVPLAELQAALQPLAGGPQPWSVQAADAVTAQPWQPPRTRLQWAPEPALPTQAGPRWWMASYTALCTAMAPAPEASPAGGGGLLAPQQPSLFDGGHQAEGQRGADAGGPAPALAGAPPNDDGPALDEGWWATALQDDPVAELAQLSNGQDSSPHTAAEDRFDEGLLAGPGPAADAQPERGTLHAFPRGGAAGTFLHGLLEWAGQQGFAQALADAPARQAELARQCASPQWQPWAPLLGPWLAEWLATPLDLRRLAPGSSPVAPASLGTCQVELEFWLAVQQVDVARVDALVTRHTLGGAPRPVLVPQQLNGLLKGFIDLVFEHEGRWYVADHKSNWLGPRDSAYHPEALRQAVLDHRYELQYVLYLTALHRLLKHRLPGYSYEQHMGGAVYLFLRGHRAPGQGLHLERPPRQLIEALDALFDGAPT